MGQTFAGNQSENQPNSCYPGETGWVTNTYKTKHTELPTTRKMAVGHSTRPKWALLTISALLLYQIMKTKGMNLTEAGITVDPPSLLIMPIISSVNNQTLFPPPFPLDNQRCLSLVTQKHLPCQKVACPTQQNLLTHVLSTPQFRFIASLYREVLWCSC